MTFDVEKAREAAGSLMKWATIHINGKQFALTDAMLIKDLLEAAIAQHERLAEWQQPDMLHVSRDNMKKALLLAHAADYLSDKPADNLTAGEMLREARRLVGLDSKD